METIIPCIKAEIKRYSSRKLRVAGVHADNAFNNDDFKQAVRPAVLHAYAANEHVGVAERRN